MDCREEGSQNAGRNGNEDVRMALIQNPRLSTTQTLPCLAMMCFTIRYNAAEERRGCMTEFLHDFPDYGFLPYHWNFKYEKFLSIAKVGLTGVAPPGWTIILDRFTISFKHEGT
ncbi:hypothetical protein GGI35DRAFT_484447 [Trichoderma velutinum]